MKTLKILFAHLKFSTLCCSMPCRSKLCLYVLSLSFLGLSVLSYPTASYADIAVVVPEDSSVEPLNRRQLSNLFLSRSNRFSNGDRAIPLEIKNNPLRKGFYQYITKKTPTQLKSYWTTLIFTGKGKPPKTFSDKDELVDYMKKHEGSVTYLHSSEVTPLMKVIYQIPSDEATP